MDFDASKIWIVGFSAALGAIAGAWIWARHAADAVSKAAGTGDDALITTAANTATSSLAAALHGGFVGGILGVAGAVAYLYFTDPDRGMKIKKMDTGDDRY